MAVLITPRLHLRPLEHSDAAALLPALSDSDNMRYWSRAPLTSLAEVQKYICWNVEDKKAECFAICTKENPDIAMGWVVLIDQREACVEIGFILTPDFQGQGFAKEAIANIVNYAFVERDIRRIEADVDPDNRASIACLKALGFSKEGFLRATWKTHIGVRDSLIYSRLATDT